MFFWKMMIVVVSGLPLNSVGGSLVGVWNGWGYGMSGGMELHFFGL